jgi:hypothetical protein
MVLARCTAAPLNLDLATISRLAQISLAGHMAVLLDSQPPQALAMPTQLEQVTLAGRMATSLGSQSHRAPATLNQREQVFLACRIATSLDLQPDLALAMLNQLVLAAQKTPSAFDSHHTNSHRALDCRRIQVLCITIPPYRLQRTLSFSTATAMKVEFLHRR